MNHELRLIPITDAMVDFIGYCPCGWIADIGARRNEVMVTFRHHLEDAER